MNSESSIPDLIWQTVAREFADVSDVEQATRIVLRLVLAALLGGLLGWERESRGKAAGLRTHMLVAMGSATFVLIPQMMGAQAGDLSRVIQGVIAGVGFLGAGAILKSSENGKEHVKGLTTAAGVWFTAAIGVAIGAGKDTAALICALLALLVLAVVPWLSKDRDDDAHQHTHKHAVGKDSDD
ncbi:MgtC/SapB family protein [Diaphorobacter aerolatus]|uniref:Protein MgtC n=1 Tax=Diaphorobacter aerolatus TaxID=1288495 RepID=A0A7H0GJG2_9BURK|nr:MgtC/SapB family protein [Diaphorobacter aerolatus]QNP48428.1 MgtC/SapB family protein [Diaphorobacter aerolatus]